jgi:hypothetical protein
LITFVWDDAKRLVNIDYPLLFASGGITFP